MSYCWTCSSPGSTASRWPSGSPSAASPRSFSPPCVIARITVNASCTAAPRGSCPRPRSRGRPCEPRWGAADEMSVWLRRISLPAVLAAGAADVALVLLYVPRGGADTAYELVRDVGVSCSFVAAGVLAAARRPDNRTGALMVVFGLAWSLHGITVIPDPVAAAGWFVVATVPDAVLAHLLAVFPEGRATTALQRVFLVANYATTVPLGVAKLLLVTPSRLDCPDCPNLLGAEEGSWSGEAVMAFGSLVEVGLAGLLLWLLVSRWHEAPEARRRLLAPVLVVGIALLAVYIGQQSLLAVQPHEAGAVTA